MCKNNKVIDRLTETIFSSLEKGVIPWKKPWNSTFPRRITGQDYKGFNILNLMVETMDKGYKSPYWASYKHITETLKGNLEGQHGFPIVYWKILKYENFNNTGEVTSKSVPYMRYSIVFNMDQVTGIDKSKYYPNKANDVKPIDKCEQVIAGYKDKPSIKYNGHKASYSPIRDEIMVPPPVDFVNMEKFYATVYHEAVHSTGHKDRLDRKEVMDDIHFGSHSYACEELVAEMGACFLCGFCGIETTTIENTTAYIQNWLGVLKDDKKLLINAASRAQKAFDYIIGTVPNDEEKGADNE